MNPYAQYLPSLLLVLGGGLQWLRQYSKFHDVWVFLIAFAFANLGYWLCFDYTHHAAWQMEVLQWALAIGGYTGTVLGATFTAARIAPNTPLIPTTNSK